MAMDLSLNKLPWYGQLAAFVALSLAGAGVFWNFYASPARQQIDTRRQELERLRREVDKGREAERQLPQFRARLAQLEADLEMRRKELPEEKDVAELLRRIQGMATQSNLTIRGFTPRAANQRQIHAEWPIGLQLEGTYHDLGGFLERVSKFPRIINVSGMNIRARENQTSGATVTADCVATTFVLLETAAAPPGAPGAAGAAAAAPRAAGN
jgi:type IV pilus assembly protein PilO